MNPGFFTCLVSLALLAPLSAGQNGDQILADFEDGDFAGWTVEGAAFGPGPSRGELRKQGPVSGYLGQGYASSYAGGLAAIGTLRSQSFKIERRYLNFLLGGGKNPETLGIRLLVDGKVVRSETGPNDPTAKIQRLDWKSWDVAEWNGREAVLEIFDLATSKDAYIYTDTATSEPAHIMVDQIVQSDADFTQMKGVREFKIGEEWLRIPVKGGARYSLLRLMEGDRLLREFEVEFADGPADFWVYEHVGEFLNRTLRLERDWQEPGANGLAAIEQVTDWPEAKEIYHEKYRAGDSLKAWPLASIWK